MQCRTVCGLGGIPKGTSSYKQAQKWCQKGELHQNRPTFPWRRSQFRPRLQNYHHRRNHKQEHDQGASTRNSLKKGGLLDQKIGDPWAQRVQRQIELSKRWLTKKMAKSTKITTKKFAKKAVTSIANAISGRSPDENAVNRIHNVQVSPSVVFYIFRLA